MYSSSTWHQHREETGVCVGRKRQPDTLAAADDMSREEPDASWGRKDAAAASVV